MFAFFVDQKIYDDTRNMHRIMMQGADVLWMFSVTLCHKHSKAF